DILRRGFPPIWKEHGAQRCFFAEQFIVDWTRLDFREASVRPVYISTAQQDEPSRAPSKRCYRGLRILQPHRHGVDHNVRPEIENFRQEVANWRDRTGIDNLTDKRRKIHTRFAAMVYSNVVILACDFPHDRSANKAGTPNHQNPHSHLKDSESFPRRRRTPGGDPMWTASTYSFGVTGYFPSSGFTNTQTVSVVGL